MEAYGWLHSDKLTFRLENTEIRIHENDIVELVFGFKEQCSLALPFNVGATQCLDTAFLFLLDSVGTLSVGRYNVL